MTKLLVSPTIAGHQVNFGSNVLSTKLDGGASRYRLDKIGSTHDVPVQWMLEAQGYNYLMAFFRTEIAYGSLPFTIDLKAVDGSAAGTYTARIKPGTFALTGYFGNVYQVSATLEITPATVNESADEALIAAGPGQ
jgi:hypothetical protein